MYKIFVLNIFIFATLPAANSDYLIVDNPAALHILDVYEQRLSQEAKKSLTSHMPFRILEEHHLLSDTYTEAVKTICDGTIYYLVKNNQGKIVTEYPEDYPLRIINARILKDTIEIVRNEKVSIQNSEEQINLAANELLQLIFEKNNRYYVRRLAPGGEEVMAG
jgi:hypothetical protein